MRLKEAEVKNTKATNSEQRLSDGGGLYLLIKPIDAGGTKLWRFQYTFKGKKRRDGARRVSRSWGSALPAISTARPTRK